MSDLLDKTDHPLAEVRLRALEALAFKLDNGLVAADALVYDIAFLPRLLRLIDAAFVGHGRLREHKDAHAVEEEEAAAVARAAVAVLLAVATAHTGAARRLAELSPSAVAALRRLAASAAIDDDASLLPKLLGPADRARVADLMQEVDRAATARARTPSGRLGDVASAGGGGGGFYAAGGLAAPAPAAPPRPTSTATLLPAPGLRAPSAPRPQSAVLGLRDSTFSTPRPSDGAAAAPAPAPSRLATVRMVSPARPLSTPAVAAAPAAAVVWPPRDRHTRSLAAQPAATVIAPAVAAARAAGGPASAPLHLGAADEDALADLALFLRQAEPGAGEAELFVIVCADFGARVFLLRPGLFQVWAKALL
ncbi:hypothetical protein HK405_007207 [Cladochytrium tenue]|nr:hypothetical protein HK405_007207 [Cladochytrium tenue]